MKELSDSRVLIVDDVTTNIDVLVNALRGEYQLSVATDGPGALSAVQKMEVDLVLLDIMMPGMDGYEVCRRLRSSPATREIPVMFLSALDEVYDKTAGFEAGGNDYLTKPFEILEVKARVKSLLKAKAYADAVKEAMERDLRVAREIQMGILPGDLTACTAGTGLDIHAFIEPAKRVGGDLYEVLRVSDDCVVVAIGDVMGKGIPASLFMAVTVTLLRTIARQTQKPEEILFRLNTELEAQNPRRMFVTMCCLTFDLRNATVSGASAGHTPLLLLPSNGVPRYIFRSSGMVLGMQPGITYGVQTMGLDPEDTLVLYTDGITDAENTAEEDFGSQRVLQTYVDGTPHSAKDVASKLIHDVQTFSAGAAQIDDIAVVAVRWTGSRRAAAVPAAAAVAMA